MKLKKHLTVLALAVSMTALTLQAAHAEPLAGNDEIRGATVIQSLPYAGEHQDLTGATPSESDPVHCWAGPTVWYSFTAPTNGTVEFTGHSRYDHDGYGLYEGGLAVYSGSADALQPLGCSVYDDDREYVSPRVRVEVQAGDRLYVMVGTRSDSTPEARIVSALFARYLSAAPRIESLTVDARGTVTKAGGATISGSIRCDYATTAEVSVKVAQPLGRRAARGTAYITTPCQPTRTHWDASLSSTTIKRFRAKITTATATATAQGDLGVTSSSLQKRVKLRLIR